MSRPANVVTIKGETTMNGVYRSVALLTLWLGTIALVLGLIGMVVSKAMMFNLTPRGLINGAVALLLLSIASHLASHKADV